MDEKYPDGKNDVKNQHIAFRFLFSFLALILLYWFLVENLHISVDKEIYFFAISVLYFINVFFPVIGKIAFEKE